MRYPPQYRDIWFMSSEPSHPVHNTPSTSSSLEDNNTHLSMVSPSITYDPLSSRIFHCDKHILKELTTLYFPWNAFHLQELFLSEATFHPPIQASLCTIKTKDFIPPRNIDWLNNPIPAHDAFEEGNMANISPTINIDISIKPIIV